MSISESKIIPDLPNEKREKTISSLGSNACTTYDLWHNDIYEANGFLWILMISILEYSGDLCHVLDIWPNAPLTHYALCRTTSCLRNAHGRVKTPPGSLSPHLLNMGLHEICASKLLVLRGGSRSASTSQPKKGADFSQVHQTWHQTHTSFGQPVLKHMSNASCIVMCHTKQCSCEQASFPSGKYIKAAAVSVTAPHFCG